MTLRVVMAADCGGEGSLRYTYCIELTFTARLWRYQAEAIRRSDRLDGAWYFVTVPPSEGAQLRAYSQSFTATADAVATRRPKPGGTLRVTVMLGHSRWKTSLFRDTARSTYLLPIKASIRTKEHLVEGAEVEVTLLPE